MSRKISEIAVRKATGVGTPCAARRENGFRRENTMISHSSVPRSLLLSGAFLTAFTLGAAAQQPAAPPPAAGAPAAAAPALPPGSPLIGRPAGNDAAAQLAPNAAPAVPAAADQLTTAERP